MKLIEFIEKNICKNSLIRLWKPIECGHEMITEDDRKVSMEWEVLRNESWMNKYSNCNVIGVKDIYVDDFYRETINIVIDINK